MYKRVQAPNSPLMPLTPVVSKMQSHLQVKSPSSIFLSPSNVPLPKNNIRRSFTPGHLNLMNLSPPSASPIDRIRDKNRLNESATSLTTPKQKINRSLIFSSAKKSIKQLRSSVRLLSNKKIYKSYHRFLSKI